MQKMCFDFKSENNFQKCCKSKNSTERAPDTAVYGGFFSQIHLAGGLVLTFSLVIIYQVFLCLLFYHRFLLLGLS